MTTTTTTAHAASWSDEYIHVGATRESAIDAAVWDWQEQIDVGEVEEPDWPHSLPLKVYTGVEWCKGAPGVEDCFCGMNHNDVEGAWLVLGWADLVEITHEVTDG